VLSKETDQLQDVQHRIELARRLFVAQGEFIYSVIRHITSNNEYVEDLFHDVFLFFVAKPVPDDVLNIRSYLYRVILDKVIDWQRSHTRYQVKIRRYYNEMKSKQSDMLDKEAGCSEDAKKIFSLIEEHLSKTESKAITLRYKKQYAIEEVAGEMNIKPRSAGRYISVGLKKIRRLLDRQERADHEEGE
jgi:RNA polymerase sigma factor (sigma-70 family)